MDTPHARLKAARIAAGFETAKGAALHFGFAPTTYNAHENGQNGFGRKVALVYAMAFNTTAEWLLLGNTENVSVPHVTQPVEIDPLLMATWQKLLVRQRKWLVQIALILAESDYPLWPHHNGSKAIRLDSVRRIWLTLPPAPSPASEGQAGGLNDFGLPVITMGGFVGHADDWKGVEAHLKAR